MSQNHKKFQKKPFNKNKSFAKDAAPNKWVWGIHAVKEAWQNDERTNHKLYITEKLYKANEDWIGKTPKISICERSDIDRLLPKDSVHQGIALECDPLEEVFLDDVINAERENEKSLVMILDQVTDPHNVGAIMRSACAFGAAGLVVQKKFAPEITGVLAKTACGAVEHVPLVREVNLSRAIESLQERGYTVIGLDEQGEDLSSISVSGKIALVMGAEGPGMREKVGQTCDLLVKLPTFGPVPTLNVSNAAAVALYAFTEKRSS